jgi:hypothetical protein
MPLAGLETAIPTSERPPGSTNSVVYCCQIHKVIFLSTPLGDVTQSLKLAVNSKAVYTGILLNYLLHGAESFLRS